MCTVFHILFGHCSQFLFFAQGQTVRTMCMNRFCIGQTDKESCPCFVHAVQKAAEQHRALRRRPQALLPKRKSRPLRLCAGEKQGCTADMANRPHTAGRGANVDGTLRMIRRGRMRCGRMRRLRAIRPQAKSRPGKPAAAFWAGQPPGQTRYPAGWRPFGPSARPCLHLPP